jgi:hypothetical protein
MYRNLALPMRAIDKFRLDELTEQNEKNKIIVSKGHFSDPVQVAKMLGMSYAINKNEKIGKLNEEWKHACNDMNNFSELIPEFYANHSALATRYDVDSILPSWTRNKDDFFLTMRAALENKFVSKQLNKWIDLVFGCKLNEGTNIYHEISNDSDLGDLPLRFANDKALLPIRAYTPTKILDEPHEERQPSMEMVIIDTQKRRFAEQLEALEAKQQEDKKKLLLEIEQLKKQLEKLLAEKQNASGLLEKQLAEQIKVRQAEMEEQWRLEKEKIKLDSSLEAQKIVSKYEEELRRVLEEAKSENSKTREHYDAEKNQLQEALQSQAIEMAAKHQSEIEEIRHSAQENAKLVSSKLQLVEEAARKVSETHVIEKDHLISQTEALMRKMDEQHTDEKLRLSKESEEAAHQLVEKFNSEKSEMEKQHRLDLERVLQQKMQQEQSKHSRELDEMLSKLLALQRERDILHREKEIDAAKYNSDMDIIMHNRTEEKAQHEKLTAEKNRLREKITTGEDRLKREVEENEKLQEQIRSLTAKLKLQSPKPRPEKIQSSLEVNLQKKIDSLTEKIADLTERERLARLEKRDNEAEYKKQIFELKQHITKLENGTNSAGRPLTSVEMQHKYDELLSENRQLKINLHVFETKYSDQVRMKEKASMIDSVQDFPSMYINMREGPPSRPETAFSDRKEKASPVSYAKQGKAREAYEKSIIPKVGKLDLSRLNSNTDEPQTKSVPTPTMPQSARIRRNTISNEQKQAQLTPRGRAYSAKGFLSPRGPPPPSSITSPR